MTQIRYHETQYGFAYGAADVTRICSDPKHGVWLEITTPREEVQIRVTRTGLIRVGKTKKRKKACGGDRTSATQ